LPCDSPKVVTLNRVPNVLPAIKMVVLVFKLHINSKTNSVKSSKFILAELHVKCYNRLNG